MAWFGKKSGGKRPFDTVSIPWLILPAVVVVLAWTTLVTLQGCQSGIAAR